MLSEVVPSYVKEAASHIDLFSVEDSVEYDKDEQGKTDYSTNDGPTLSLDEGVAGADEEY